MPWNVGKSTLIKSENFKKPLLHGKKIEIGQELLGPKHDNLSEMNKFVETEFTKIGLRKNRNSELSYVY